MPNVNTISSNGSGLRIALEDSLKTLPVTPIWNPVEPNSYGDFGGNISTVARNPISASRQRLKGVTTDLDATAQFTVDLTQTNISDLLQGFMFANFIRKTEFGGASEVTNVDGTANEYDAAAGLDAFAAGNLIFASGFGDSANNGLKQVSSAAAAALGVVESLNDEAAPPAAAKLVLVGHQSGGGDLDVDVAGTYPALTSTVLDFTTLGINPGEMIFVGGDLTVEQFANAVNNGFKRVRSVAANRLEFDKSDQAMVAETTTSETVRLFFGRVLKNRTGTDIVCPTYQLERTLGAPDEAQPTQIQAEYVVGAVANELTMNINTADKITADLNYVGVDVEFVDGPTALKAGTRPTLQSADAFNTSSDFSRIRLAQVVEGNVAPDPLFAYVSELSLGINNNVTPAKAVGTLGAFGLTSGTFEVSSQMTAYFQNVAAVQAVRNNADVTLDFVIAKQNAGISFDLPLVSLGDARNNVEQDQPITLPLTADAASGSKISTDLDHTLLMVFFDYLPNAAQ
jgi:hypothetical protein